MAEEQPQPRYSATAPGATQASPPLSPYTTRDNPRTGTMLPQVVTTPNPDPTQLTAIMIDDAKEQLRRELLYQREGVLSLIHSTRQIIEARIDATDKATELLQTIQDRLPDRISDAVRDMHRLIEQQFETTNERFTTMLERFASIQTQFAERDVRTDKSETNVNLAIAAALSAQKEMAALQNVNIAQALARIEATAQKQIEQVVTLGQATSAGVDSKINDLKERLSLIEGRTAGITAATTTQQAAVTTQQGTSGNIIAVIAIVVGALMGLAGVLMAVIKP